MGNPTKCIGCNLATATDSRGYCTTIGCGHLKSQPVASLQLRRKPKTQSRQLTFRYQVATMVHWKEVIHSSLCFYFCLIPTIHTNRLTCGTPNRFKRVLSIFRLTLFFYVTISADVLSHENFFMVNNTSIWILIRVGARGRVFSSLLHRYSQKWSAAYKPDFEIESLFADHRV